MKMKQVSRKKCVDGAEIQAGTCLVGCKGGSDFASASGLDYAVFGQLFGLVL